MEEDKSCNTKKTRDKRERRHTVGIMVGTKPCGTVVLFEEIFGSESLTQVYGMLVEYLSRLTEEGRHSLKNILYDDACHLKKFAEKKVCCVDGRRCCQGIVLQSGGGGQLKANIC